MNEMDGIDEVVIVNGIYSIALKRSESLSAHAPQVLNYEIFARH